MTSQEKSKSLKLFFQKQTNYCIFFTKNRDGALMVRYFNIHK